MEELYLLDNLLLKEMKKIINKDTMAKIKGDRDHILDFKKYLSLRRDRRQIDKEWNSL